MRQTFFGQDALTEWNRDLLIIRIYSESLNDLFSNLRNMR